MSLKGIDAQIMLQRATDFAKESSSQLKRADIQDSLKAREMNQFADQLIKNVQQADRAELQRIDPNGAGNQEEAPKEEEDKRREKASEEQEDPELILRDENYISKNRVDVRI